MHLCPRPQNVKLFNTEKKKVLVTLHWKHVGISKAQEKDLTAKLELYNYIYWLVQLQEFNL